MSAAARTIHLTPSAVSRLISSAERQLGYVLFDRVGATLVPTVQARTLFAESRALFQSLESLRRTAVRLRGGIEQRLRVAAIPAISHRLLPDVLTRFQQAHSQVVCEVHTVPTPQVTGELLAGQADVGLDFYGIGQAGLHTRVVGIGPLYAMFQGSDLPAKLSESPSADVLHRYLSTQPLVALAQDDPMSAAFRRYCARHGLRPSTRMEVQTSALAEELVSRGAGWAVVDFLSAAKRAPGVCVIELRPRLDCSLHAFFNEGASLNPLTRDFIATVRRVVAEMAPTAGAADQ